MIDPDLPPLDTELLRGFRFACRPDCGLCCYAEPRVELSERSALVQIRPETEFRTTESGTFLVARPDGGACQFLEGQRCRAHALRPHPCREFPVTVHLGRRLQATLVLSCPGLDLAPLTGDPGPSAAPEGLAEEVRAVSQRRGPETGRRLAEARRRGRRIERELTAQGRWQPDDQVRHELEHRLPLPGPRDFPVEEPPSREDGVSHLPLFFDGRAGPVALASGLGGWEILELTATGGARPVDLVVPPERPPRMTPGGARLLEGYLRYWVQRDAFLAAVHLEMLEAEHGPVLEWAAADLRALGALTLARGAVRSKLRGGDGELLTELEVANGIRAVDQDALDRPTWGDRF